MLEQIATSISTTATKTASDSIMTYIQKIAVGEMIEPQVDISSHDDDTQRLLRHKTTTTLFVILLDVEFGKVKGRKQEDRLMLLADVATETSAIDAVSKKQLQSLEEYLDTIKKPRMSQASKTAWVHATRNEASRLLGLRRERVQLSKTRTTLRSILKSETARAISLVHFVKRQLHERDQSKQVSVWFPFAPISYELTGMTLVCYSAALESCVLSTIRNFAVLTTLPLCSNIDLNSFISRPSRHGG